MSPKKTTSLQMPHAESEYLVHPDDAIGALLDPAARCAYLHWNRLDVSRVPLFPDSVALDARVFVFVNHGRWIALCPNVECGGAQFACITDKRFYCPDCLNGWCDHKYAVTMWPEDRDIEEIERQLTRRQLRNRHWLAHEPVTQLAEENDDHADELSQGIPANLRALAADVPQDRRDFRELHKRLEQ